MDDKFPLGLTFDDVLLEPRPSAVFRNEADVSTRLTRKLKLKIPIIAAAMDTVSEAEMAIALGKLGGVAVLHRNCTAQAQLAMVTQVKKQKVLCAAAVGPADVERAQMLDRAGADIIVVDTAHAHNLQALANARIIKKIVKAQVIVGNIATAESARELVKFADAIKVGIGPGSICTTRVVAGVGVPQLSAILEVAAIARKKNIPVIADGGMRYSGDIVKALAAGAETVMLGSMLAGTAEAPGKIVKIRGQKYKVYRGMGSFEAMQTNQSSDRYFQKNAFTHIPEGVTGITKYKGSVKEVIKQIVGGLKSGMGYIGAVTIPAMPRQARFIRITNAGLRESHPHDIQITKKSPNY